MPRILSGSHWWEGDLRARVGAMIKIGKSVLKSLRFRE
jgi:hypothetical protein